MTGQEIHSGQTKNFPFFFRDGTCWDIQVLVSKEHSNILFSAYVMFESSHTEMILPKHYGSYGSELLPFTYLAGSTVHNVMDE